MNNKEMMFFGGFNKQYKHKDCIVYDIESKKVVSRKNMIKIENSFVIEENNCLRQNNDSVLFLTSGDAIKFELC